MPLYNRSQYVEMSDGIRLAVDLWLPDHPDSTSPVPIVMRSTRYWRAAEGARAPNGDLKDITAEARIFAEAGCGLLTLDVRGTGVSFGSWDGVWTRREILDLGEVVDWIISESWSNGRVGAYGSSYDGNTAELLAANCHPAVTVVSPRFADYDTWTHLAMPGGVFLDSFVLRWGNVTQARDRDDLGCLGLSSVEQKELRHFAGHPKRVDADEDGSLRSEAIAGHANNVDIGAMGAGLIYRDDPAAVVLGLEEVGSFARRQEIEKSNTLLRSDGSWLDAGTAATVITRFLTNSNPQRATIGAWSHGGETSASPYAPPASIANPPIEEQLSELAAFMGEFLKPDVPALTGRRLRYYTLGEEEWHETEVWPPAGVENETFYFHADGHLNTDEPNENQGSDLYAVDFSTTTGSTTNRWQTQSGGGAVVYGNRQEEDAKLLTYTTSPLQTDLELSGHPIVHLAMSSTEPDGAVFAYLEEMDPDGRVTYLSEGQLRLLHRKTSGGPPPYRHFGPYRTFRREDASVMQPGCIEQIEFALLPVSVLLRRGHCLRIAIAGHDEGTFARLPEQGNPVYEIDRNRSQMSSIELPIRRLRGQSTLERSSS